MDSTTSLQTDAQACSGGYASDAPPRGLAGSHVEAAESDEGRQVIPPPLVTTDDALREAMGASELKQGLSIEAKLGAVADGLDLANKGVSFGFKCAEVGTNVGFGVTTKILGWFGMRNNVGKVVDVAHTITRGSQELARGITQTSINAAAGGLDLAGAERGTAALAGASKVIGEEETYACLAVAKAAREFSGVGQGGSEARDSVFGGQPGFKRALIAGLIQLGTTGYPADGTVSSTAAVRSAGPLPIVALHRDHARLLWLCAAMYGHNFNMVIGTYHEFWRVPSEEFLKAVVNTETPEYHYELIYHRDEVNIETEGASPTSLITDQAFPGASSSGHSSDDAAASSQPQSTSPTRSATSNEGSSHQRSRVYYPAHAVLVHLQSKSIVVAIRGTASIRDALTDLVCHPYEVPQSEKEEFGLLDMQREDGTAESSPQTMHVHHGMWIAACRLGHELAPKVAELFTQHPDFKIAITGHSLGAGTASLLGYLWKRGHQLSKLLPEELATRLQVTCVAFATPQTMDPQIADQQDDYMTSVLHGDDMVPRFSLRTALDLSETALYLGKRGDTMQDEHVERLATGAAASSSATSPPRNSSPRQDPMTVHSHIPHLRPPGKVVHLKPHGDGSAPVESERETFGALKISRKMLVDHMWLGMLKSMNEV